MFGYNPAPKPGKSVRVKPTQRQMGVISTKVREIVKQRSGSVCEVCRASRAVDMAHITGRKQLNHVTTAEDIIHACKKCHIWLDEHPDGIRHKRKLREGA